MADNSTFASTGPHGHRSRMRTRLLAGGPNGLADYELLEMLLFLSIPRRDTKPLAKAIINRFGDLYRSLNATAADLRKAGLDQIGVGLIDLVREAARRLADAEVVSRPLLKDAEALATYLDLPARSQRPPHLAVLFLNNRNQLLADLPFTEAQGPADVTEAVGRRAVEIHASALIMVSFRLRAPPIATDRDRDLTRRIQRTGKLLSITLHDHFIFGDGGNESLKRQGLL